MSKLLVPSTSTNSASRLNTARQQSVIEGDVVRRNWDIDSAKDCKVRAGVFGPFELLGRRPDVDPEGFGMDRYGRAAALRLDARPAT
nr:hypothetical protein [Variovorax paradoxus]